MRRDYRETILRLARHEVVVRTEIHDVPDHETLDAAHSTAVRTAIRLERLQEQIRHFLGA